MESAAEPGTTLITGDTHRLVCSLFDAESLGRIEVKGKAEPVPVYRILASKSVARKLRGTSGLESPLVGREVELGVLNRALERLNAGVGGIVTLVGEAGIGKSRLVAELRKSEMAASPRWEEGRCLSYGASITYLLWLDLLRSILGMSVEDSPVAVRDALKKLVQTLCPEQADDVYPYLGQLMSLPLEAQDEATVAELEGEKLKAATFRAVATLVECLASERPLVLICEDLHWVDPSSLELLEHLMGLTDRASLLLLCVFRPNRDHGSWRLRETAARQFPHRHTSLWLDSLSAAESARLVSNLLRVEDLPEQLQSHILGHAEGNPFYVEEVLRSLIDRGAIAQDEASGEWEATQDVSGIAIPDTLQGVLMARIDRLHEESKRVLQLASVIGRIFLYRILAAISEEERELDAQLVALQREEMIRERARMPELEYIFKHELTREAAYNGLLKKQRRGFHLQVAEALERLFPGRMEEQPELLAHHFTQAEAWPKAFLYLTKSGHKARRAFANQEAIAFYTQALEVSERITPPLDATQLLPVYEGRGLVWRLLMRMDEAITDFYMMRQMASAAGNQQKEGESLFRLADAHYWKLSDKEIPIAEQYGQEAVRLAQLTGDQRTAARYLTSLALVDQTRGDPQKANSKLEESLQISRREGYKDSICENLRWLGSHAYFLGEYEQGVSLLKESLAVARDINDGFAELLDLAFLSLHQGSLGDFGEALNTIQEGMTKAEERENQFVICRMPNHLGWIHGLFGDFTRAEAYDRKGAELAHTYGQIFPEISALINLGADYLGLGQYERARSQLQPLIERIEVGNFGAHRWLWKPRLLNVLAEAYHAMGNHGEALRYVEESVVTAEATSLQKYMAKGWALRGRILADLGQTEAAGQDLQRAFALAEKIKSPAVIYPIAFELGQWHERAGQEREAAELYGKARARVERMTAAMEDEALCSIFLQSAAVQAIDEACARVG
jgi:predicted ATPase